MKRTPWLSALTAITGQYQYCMMDPHSMPARPMRAPTIFYESALFVNGEFLKR